MTMSIEVATLPQDVPVAFSKVGPYRLGREIGRGALGVLYEAEHVEQGRKVAIKMLDPHLIGLEKASRQDARFAREAMILADMPRHAGIVGILDAGLSDGRPYIVTERIEGQSLKQALQVRTLEERALVRIVRDIALAAHHAHEHKILHRNIKPSNVLLDGEGRARLTDFGAAKKVDPNAHQSTTFTIGASVGTPVYMSPERAAGLKTVDRRADVYSLGAMLYEVITGRPPYELSGTVSDLVTIVRGDVRPASQVRPQGGAMGGDVILQAICMKALSRSAQGRQATAKEFADELTAWLGESTVVEVPAPSPVAIAGVCLAAGLIAATALAFVVFHG